jgi:2Fe-2S ferredoxin
MPKIVISNLYNRKIISKSNDKNALEIIHENYIDWMHACGKKGRCTTCKMIVAEGEDQLGPVTEREQKFIDAGKLKAGERLACQAIVKGDIVIKVAERNKFPHMDYSD